MRGVRDRGENTLGGGSIKLCQDRTGDVEFPQLSEEEHPTVGPFNNGAGVRLPLEVIGDGGAEELNNVEAAEKASRWFWLKRGEPWGQKHATWTQDRI